MRRMIARYVSSTAAQPTKPHASPMVAKMKSVQSAGTKSSWLQVPSTNMPLPHTPPEPMQILEWVC